jgi:beta-fructofuranosidase
MTLRLDDHWVWDFWFARDGLDVHVFFLHAPRSLGDPELRHRNARIGHAVSRDLRNWEVLPPAMEPGPPGAFDDMATWTGSVFAKDGVWHMFYTGISTRDDGAVQRVGLATSRDLERWERQDLAFEADERWYRKRGPGVAEEAWRDPWVFRDEDSGCFRMLLTATAAGGPLETGGVIGQARSVNLRDWEAEAPLFGPGDFSMLEVPQLVRLGGRWRVLFSTIHEGRSGTGAIVARDQLGPYRLPRRPFLVRDDLYAGRLIEHDGEWWLMAWHQRGPDGQFGGELADPLPVRVSAGPGDVDDDLDLAVHPHLG